jgi:RNA polymerase sigma-70 factor (ECF subfamily)
MEGTNLLYKNITMDTSLSCDLVVRAQKGELDAIGELYDLHHQAIFLYFRSRLDDPHLAEDLTGDVFKRMLTSLSQYQPRGLPFRSWLFRIAHNLLVDYLKREGGTVHIGVEGKSLPDEHAEDPFLTVEKKQAVEQAYQALSELAPSQREILVLRFLSGLSLREVALTLNLTEDSVKAHQRRGLAVLRLVLAKD